MTASLYQRSDTSLPRASWCGAAGSGGVRRVLRGDDLRRHGWRGRGPVAERPPAQLLATVRPQPAGEVGTVRHDAGRVDVLVHQVVVLLDVLEVHGVAEPWGLEQIPRVG